MRAATLLLLLHLAFAAFASAITPPEPWHTHKIFSANKRFYARVTPDGKTSIKEARRLGWFAKSLWSTPNYFEYALLSDDGSFLVSSNTLIAPPFLKNQMVIEIYHRDGVKKLNLGLFVNDPRKLQDAMGFKSFGGATALDGDWIIVDNGAGKIFAVNARTGKLRLKTEGKGNHSRP